MDLEDSESFEEKDPSSPEVVDKYKAAGTIANEVLIAVLKHIQPGMSVVDVCKEGDAYMEELVKKSYKKVKNDNKGIAFPTCISINNCAGHMSPLPEDAPIIIQKGDMVKVDLGVHIDGFVAQCAHTWVVGREAEQGPITGPPADVICAVHYATECALRLLRPGKTNTDVTNIIKKCAETYNVNPVEGVLSHQMKQRCIDANQVIINREELDQRADEFQFEPNQVYALDILMSTGEGKTREITNRTTVFKRAADRNYKLKLQASREVLYEISQKAPYFCFSLRQLDEKKRRMGIVEIVKHELVDTYPVLWEKDGEYIAQFKTTVMILPNQTVRLNGPFPLPHVSSSYCVDNVPEIQQVMQMSLQRTKKKKNNRRKKKTNEMAEEATLLF